MAVAPCWIWLVHHSLCAGARGSPAHDRHTRPAAGNIRIDTNIRPRFRMTGAIWQAGPSARGRARQRPPPPPREGKRDHAQHGSTHRSGRRHPGNPRTSRPTRTAGTRGTTRPHATTGHGLRSRRPHRRPPPALEQHRRPPRRTRPALPPRRHPPHHRRRPLRTRRNPHRHRGQSRPPTRTPPPRAGLPRHPHQRPARTVHRPLPGSDPALPPPRRRRRRPLPARLPQTPLPERSPPLPQTRENHRPPHPRGRRPPPRQLRTPCRSCDALLAHFGVRPVDLTPSE